ncbi:hypothetical protein PC110_g19240 [Phytophthora cactorum]|uniref:HTH CENPB-type domain-containing protein n=1 Tax=Phytophthora cactorum TaxID=29920 RepID=A0A329RHZ8_9STRA|nr:hypothetical protein PC110_g19240 [Phytophthora cactorum]
MLAVHARQVATENGVNNFSASDKWIKDFKGRHRLSMRAPTRQSQISPEDIDKVKTDFAAEVAETARQLGITRIYNADPTAVFFNICPHKIS